MPEHDETGARESWEARLASARARRPGTGSGSIHTEADGDAKNGLAVGMRIGIELVVAVVVGTAIGWAFDKTFGTKHFGLGVFFVLGVAAGMLNVYRALTAQTGAVGYRNRRPGASGKTDELDGEG
jgi:ATP synthase protein I